MVCNHLYLADPAYFMCRINRKMLVLGKKELFEKRIPRWFFTNLNVVPLDRDNPSQQTLKKAVNTLKKEGIVLLFPEGTRNKENTDLMPFRDGAAMLALMTESPIIPCYIANRAGLWGKAKVYIGKPFELTEFYGQKATKEVCGEATQVIKDEIQLLKNVVDGFAQKKLKKAEKVLMISEYRDYQ